MHRWLELLTNCLVDNNSTIVLVSARRHADDDVQTAFFIFHMFVQSSHNWPARDDSSLNVRARIELIIFPKKSPSQGWQNSCFSHFSFGKQLTELVTPVDILAYSVVNERATRTKLDTQESIGREIWGRSSKDWVSSRPASLLFARIHNSLFNRAMKLIKKQLSLCIRCCKQAHRKASRATMTR